jgi:ribosome-associated protein
LHAARPSAISFPNPSARSSPRITSTWKKRPIDSEKLARLCAHFAAEKKAENLVAIDLRGISSFTDFFVICSGTSEPHLKAIAGELRDRLKQDHGVKPLAVDGFPTSQWIVADYSDVVVHIFHTDKRAFYSLEDLWSDAPRLKLAL